MIDKQYKDYLERSGDSNLSELLKGMSYDMFLAHWRAWGDDWESWDRKMCEAFQSVAELGFSCRSRLSPPSALA